jgi:hypothetical protein
MIQILSDLTTTTFMLKHLEKNGISVPSYALVNREFPYQELDHLIEQEDFVEIHRKRFLSPLWRNLLMVTCQYFQALL